MQYKTCTKCGKELPATAEYFSKDKRIKCGLAAKCKDCNRMWKEENKERIKQYKKKYREENKEMLSEQKKAYYEQNKEHIKQYKKKYYEENKEMLSEQKKAYYEQNKEHINEYQKQWRESHKEYNQKYKSKWYQENAQRLKPKHQQYREKNKDKLHNQAKQWKTINKDRVAIHNAKRRSLKKQLPATLTVQQWQKIKEIFNHQCAYCGKPLTKLTQEHFIPVSKGGEYTHNNIIPACQSCNCSKQAKDFFEWYPQQPYYSKEREQKILDFLGYQQGIQQLTIALQEVKRCKA